MDGVKKRKRPGKGGRLARRKSYATQSKLDDSKDTSSACGVEPIIVHSSPEKVVTKIPVSSAVETAILSLLDSAFDENDEKIKLLTGILSQLKRANAVSPTHSVEEVVCVNNASSSDNSMTIAPLVLPSGSIRFNPDAFFDPNRKGDSNRKAKNRMVDRIEAAVTSVGNQEKQLLVLHEFLRYKQSSKPLAEALCVLVNGHLHCLREEGFDVVANLKEIFEYANSLNTNNQVASLNAFQRSLMLALSPSQFTGDVKKVTSQFGKVFGISRYRARKYVQRGIQDRLQLVGGDMSLFMPAYKRKQSTKYTKDLILSLHYWLLNTCEGIVVSPHSNDTKLVRDIYTGLQSRQQKFFYKHGVNNILTEMGKPVEDGGFDGPRNDEGELMISDTMLRAMLPTNLSRMTDSHMDLCGCELCFVPKKLLESLYAFSTRILKSDSVSDSDKESIIKFLYTNYEKRERRYPDAMSVVKDMTCLPVIGEDIFPFKCILGRCQNCPTLSVPDAFKNKEDDAKRISFVTYEYHSFCKIHKSLDGAPSKCPHCDESDNKPKGVKGKLFNRKKQVTQQNETIGEFFDSFFLPVFNQFKYHIQHVILLGKNHCVKQRSNSFKTIGRNHLKFIRDFMDVLTCTFNNQFQSTHFGENATVNSEGLGVEFWKPMLEQTPGEEANTDLEWHAFLSDNSRQDSRTVYANTDRLVKEIQKRNLLDFSEQVWLWDQSDGASKQYRCGNSLKLMASISCKHRVSVNKALSAPHHGKAICDSQGGCDKSEMRVLFRDPATSEVDGGNKMSAATVDCKGKRISMAKMAVQFLSDQSRVNGVKSYGKKREKREKEARISRRNYHYMDHGTTDGEQNSFLPIITTKFKAVGFPAGKKGEKHNGLGAHYHFWTDYELGPDHAAARRIPCSCAPCLEKLQQKWDYNLSPKQQPRFQTAEDCELGPALAGFNQWHILHLVPVSGDDQEEEIEELFEDILSELEATVTSQIQIGDFAAYESEEDYYIIRWSSLPFPYTEEDGEVEGAATLEPGAAVAKGYYYENPGRATKWYVETKPKVERLFRIRYVPCTGLTMEGTDIQRFPIGTIRSKTSEKLWQ